MTATARIITYEPHERIASSYIRNEFMWDRMGDVNWSLLRQSLASAEHVCANPGKFPRADFDALEEKITEIGDFLFLHMQDRADQDHALMGGR